jgi:hypothetical protein
MGFPQGTVRSKTGGSSDVAELPRSHLLAIDKNTG